jgi:hypothetical protein
MGSGGVPLEIISIEELMNDYRVIHLIEVMNSLKGLEVATENWVKNNSRDLKIDKSDAAIEGAIMPVLETCKKQCELLELKKSLRRLAELRGPMNAGCLTYEQLRVQVQELRKDIQLELSDRRFAFVPVDHVDKLTKMTANWYLIWGYLPDCIKDTQDAIDCYVLKLYTASVFHSMRIAEVGLRNLATELEVTLKDREEEIPIEFADWNKVITGISNKIKAAHTLPANHKREQELTFYSDMADRCGYMKDMWRNPVSHARKVFNQGEASGVLDRVHGFMSLLANHLQEKRGGEK